MDMENEVAHDGQDKIHASEPKSLSAYMREFKAPTETFSEVLWMKRYGRDNNDSLFVELMVETRWYRVKEVRMLFNECNDFCYEETGDWDMERYLIVDDPTAVSKLMCKFSTHDGKTLFRRIKERFSPYGREGFSEFKNFLDKKQIEYSQITY